MKSNYQKCLAFTLQFEGGYVNHPRDPGGETNKGVTKRVYDAYRTRKGKAVQSVRNISDAELQEIYKRQYWDAVHGDELPIGVDACVFDLAVNSGPGRAVKQLQQALGVKVDGNLGLATVAAANGMSRTILINALIDRRNAFLKSLGTFPTFGKGWMRRTAALRKAALAMK
jgi:lysozyme family protein